MNLFIKDIVSHIYIGLISLYTPSQPYRPFVSFCLYLLLRHEHTLVFVTYYHLIECKDTKNHERRKVLLVFLLQYVTGTGQYHQPKRYSYSITVFEKQIAHTQQWRSRI